MNTFDIKTSKENKRSPNGIFYGRDRWRNGGPSHVNPVFRLDESDSDLDIDNEISHSSKKLTEEQDKKESSEAVKDWDQCVTYEPEEEDNTLSTEWMNAFIGFFKLLIYLLTFVSMIFFGVLSIASLLLMTSMIRNNQKVVLCTKHFQQLIPGRTYLATFRDSDPERIAWIWSLYVVMTAPIVVSLYRCSKYCLFKNHEKPKVKTFLTVFTTETLHTIGFVLLIIMVLPDVNSSRGPMLSHSICLMPSILAFISRLYKNNNKKRITLLALDLMAVVLQLVCLIGWTAIAYFEDNQHVYGIPVVLFLISIGFWDNYLVIKRSKSLNGFLSYFCDIKKDLNKSRYFTYVLISVWKIVLIFAIVLIYFSIMDVSEDTQVVKDLFRRFGDAFSQHSLNISRLAITFSAEELPIITSNPTKYLYLILIQIFSTLFCYFLAKFVCKIQIQIFSFTFPLTIVSPIAIAIITVLCRLHLRNECQILDVLKLDYIFWHSNVDLNDELTAITYTESLVWLLSLFSQIWVTLHIWRPKSERLAKAEVLFTKPEFCCAFIDQSLVLNRMIETKKLTKSDVNNRKMSAEELEQSHCQTVRIYMCATMWHENEEEMDKMIKSVFRMDVDQSARRHAINWLNAKPTDYYEIETHILFDDSFEDKGSERVVNSYVKQLINVMDLSASCVYECPGIKLKPPTLTTTPYGGRLVWTLPGQNQLFVHLKDKNKIRHKKRWSQVMYMYYLLGFRFKDMDAEKREEMAENTFILALDGDINFRPKAVSLLVDLMIKHKNLGAACGRIHPIGSGPMVWYQKFEYAIGHWLQKATEHVIGCVLCSPGCFSLFRAKALMTENVMKKYTTIATEALQYVQYDQGEDRWLCTLLLQQGWRIEYCAASDSYTHAPESYGEFYNQRRRWAPSTLFNIWDLLTEFKRTVRVNDNISKLYIIYQFALLIGTVFSPGTIFLMIVGAMSTSFGLSPGICLITSGTPILFFIFVCFYAKNETQIQFSVILSIGYALLMLAVIVSTIIEMVQEGLWQPSAIFFISLLLSFLIAALIHPTEFLCFLPILLYMLCIPSMYLLLTIYYVINMNVVSWGTRETRAPEQTTDPQVPQQKGNHFLNNVKNLFKSNENSRLFSCVCCSNSVPNDDKEVLKEIKEIKCEFNEIKNFIQTVEPVKYNPLLSETLDPMNRFMPSRLSYIGEDIEEENNKPSNEEFFNKYKRRENGKPFWAKDICFKSFPEQSLESEEALFWREFIDSYLLPLASDPTHEEKVKFDLKELRDKVSATFGLLNSLFILLVLLLQMHKDVFEFRFNFGNDIIRLDVIGMSLVLFFGIILIIQFFGMIWHRFSTFSLLLSTTEVKLFKRSHELTNAQQVIDENAVQIAKQLQKLNSYDINDNQKKRTVSKRPETQAMHTVSPQRQEFSELEDAFLKRCLSLKNNFDNEQILPRSKLARIGRSTLVRGSDVRKGVYDNVRNTIRRKRTNVSTNI